ncbi:hypothetical protein VE04_01240 [Pseudogymnoascus sp. 24MN13]|nr:hypothetical protein VE04_01240 [Pseudogymnoascus sp. 24MN13]
MAQVLTIASGTQVPAVNFHAQKYSVDKLEANEVLIKMLAAPINPLDILVLAGVYPVKPSHTHLDEPILGYDGKRTTLSPGDLVVPSKFGTGTWRTHAVLDAASLQRVTYPTDLAFASILRIGIAPAFCLVEDMRALKPGDYIIQNAGTSLLAQFVIQFARRRGVNVINVVRDREAYELEKVETALRKLGAEIVVTEVPDDGDARVKNKRIMLALDSVFGTSGRGLVKAPPWAGRGPIAIDPTDLFARQLTMKGFRGSAQVGLRSAEEQVDLFNWFVELFNNGELQLPALGLQKVKWSVGDAEGSKGALLEAVERAKSGALGQRKQIILFE